MQINGTFIEQGAFYDSVVELAKKVGVAMPKLLVVDSHLPNAFAVPLLNKQGNAVVLSQGALDLFNELPTKPASQEMRVLLAHEMAHTKFGLYNTLAAKALPLTALPIVAVMARHYINKAYPTMPELQAPEGVDEKAVQQRSYQLKDAAKDLAAATAGLVAGALVTRKVSIATEFYCDRIAAEVVSPEASKRMLSTLHDGFHKAARQGLKEGDVLNFSVSEGSGKPLNELFKALVLTTFHAHPSEAQRLMRLDEMIEKAQQQNAAVKRGGKAQPHHAAEGLGEGMGDGFIDELLEGMFGKKKTHNLPTHAEGSMPEVHVDAGDADLGGLLDGIGAALHRS